MNSLPQKIRKRIRGKGRGWVFTPKDLLDLANRTALDKALSRMASDGEIRRLKHGLYDYPRLDPAIGVISPHPRNIADALARKTGDTIYPAGAEAANLIGLSTQVQAQPVYYTTGPAKVCRVGNYTIRLKHTPFSDSLKLSLGARIVLYALLWLGERGVDDSVVEYLRAKLTPKDKKQLSTSINVLPGWIVPKVKAITA